MYGKIFKQMYKGTLAMVGPWEALVTFQQMIVLADRSGIVDMTADAISRETTIPLRIIKKGITALEQPDPESRTPDEEGRRLVLLDGTRSWGWRIVNYDHYRRLRSEEERREYHRQYYREKRSKSAVNKLSTATQQSSTDSTNSSKQYVEAVSKKTHGQTLAGFDLFWAAYPRKVKKKTAREIWQRKKPDADTLIADVQNRLTNDAQWKDGFIPHPTTYLNGERWNDEIVTARSANGTLTYSEQLKSDMIASGQTEGLSAK